MTRNHRGAPTYWPFVAILAFWTIPFSLSWAITVRNVGTTSNILIAHGKVWFAQQDRSLTVLDLRTGDVLLRKTDGRYGGTFREGPSLFETPGGVVLRKDNSSCVFLDKDSLKAKWESPTFCPKRVQGNLVLGICAEGNTISCRDVETGDIRWERPVQKYPYPRIASDMQHVFIRQIPEFEVVASQTLTLRRLEDGQELFCVRRPKNSCEEKIYLSKDAAYLARENVISTTRTLITVEELGFDGKVRRVLTLPEIPEREAADIFRCESLFTVDGLAFFPDGQCQRIRDYLAESGLSESALTGSYQWVWPFTRYPSGQPVPMMENGRLVGFFDFGDRSIEFRPAQGSSWKAKQLLRIYPYIPIGPSAHDRMASWGRFLVLADMGGCVECLDLKVGRTAWCYIFPAPTLISRHRGREWYRAAAESEMSSAEERAGYVATDSAQDVPEENCDPKIWDDYVKTRKKQLGIKIVRDPVPYLP